jgi:hypothetical protein
MKDISKSAKIHHRLLAKLESEIGITAKQYKIARQQIYWYSKGETRCTPNALQRYVFDIVLYSQMVYARAETLKVLELLDQGMEAVKKYGEGVRQGTIDNKPYAKAYQKLANYIWKVKHHHIKPNLEKYEAIKNAFLEIRNKREVEGTIYTKNQLFKTVEQIKEMLSIFEFEQKAIIQKSDKPRQKTVREQIKEINQVSRIIYDKKGNPQPKYLEYRIAVQESESVKVSNFERV